MVNEAIVRINNLQKKYKDKQIFNGLNLMIMKGQITTIFGPSGVGKSTLLNIIGTLESFDDGDVNLFGMNAPKINSKQSMLLRREKISYLFQNFGLIDDQSIKQNLEIACQYMHTSKKEKQLKINKALQTVGIELDIKTKIYQLSGGEQQRIAIARLLLKPSELILADEPTGSLDFKNRNFIIQEMLNLKSKGKTIVIVTHDPEFKKISDNIVHL
ncbi:putative bacteriocin export ABC transporter [Leuconostoc lactis]|uniref:putative bacteriocin export ABC transporter n=1 Tax=Leuconostoc lactis TaxID=1246 RepID=UPI0015F61CFD|nr:putative bacteriocin export ABC transporter [Leuconostoc lactis]MBA5813363.1 putative bacteriocin export ABC transporter [Leuconostoc lactis]MCT8386905.1 ATP-binding cassette domain-containing protein [Leuconostoc lactis]